MKDESHALILDRVKDLKNDNTRQFDILRDDIRAIRSELHSYQVRGAFFRGKLIGAGGLAGILGGILSKYVLVWFK